MSLQLLNGKFQPIEIKSEALGIGAEGSVYEIIYPAHLAGYVVKIYRDIEKAPLKQEKIEYLIKHKPQLKEPLSVIFPEDIVYQTDGRFIGFIMKKALGEFDLTSLCTFGNSDRLPKEWHDKYNRNAPQGLKNRLKICYNIAAAVNQVHRGGKFTFVDLKPENIKISFDGRVSIVDIDSIAIANGKELIFPAERLTPEYSPAEFTETNLKKDVIDETWDRFSISVLFYKILFGIHPYAGTTKGNYAHLNSNEQKIIEGLFPQGQKSEHFEIIPEPHKKFKEAPYKVRKLFLNCFEEGQFLPSKRPSAADWCQVLVQAQPRNFYLNKLLNLHFSWKIPKINLEKLHREPMHFGTMNPKSTSGILPSLLIFIVLLGSSFGVVNLSGYYRAQKLIREGDTRFGKEVKSSSNDLRMSSYDHHPDKDYFDFPSEGISITLDNGRWGYLDVKTQEIILEAKYDWVYDFKEGRGRVRNQGLYGFVDRQGKFIVKPVFEDAYDFRNGRALVSQNGKYMFIDLEGNKLFELDGDKIYDFSEGLALLKKDGMYGYIDEKGILVIPAQFDMAYPFREGLAAIEINGKWGYINKKGQVAIALAWDNATSFSDGVATVTRFEREYDINTYGEITRSIIKN
ncbi:MAG: WG repeat-containing protein [Microscillaceae bacterium]|nr:WG repeat-containing protein [Microscillaceae bacterium]